MFCSHCRYPIQRSDSFWSGCGIPIGRRSEGWPGTLLFTELARDARLLTGSRRAVKFAMIPLILVVLLAIGWTVEVLFRGVPHP